MGAMLPDVHSIELRTCEVDGRVGKELAKERPGGFRRMAGFQPFFLKWSRATFLIANFEKALSYQREVINHNLHVADTDSQTCRNVSDISRNFHTIANV
jgi:hypothetical protein